MSITTATSGHAWHESASGASSGVRTTTPERSLRIAG
jgi:hypothetical protein